MNKSITFCTYIQSYQYYIISHISTNIGTAGIGTERACQIFDKFAPLCWQLLFVSSFWFTTVTESLVHAYGIKSEQNKKKVVLTFTATPT